MKELSVREAREAIGRLDQLLADEDAVTITRHGEPIARLLPIVRRRPIPSHRELRDSMRPLGTPSEALVREERDGR